MLAIRSHHRALVLAVFVLRQQTSTHMAHEDGETCRGLVATKGNDRIKVRVRTSDAHATREDVVRCTLG